MNNDFIKIPLDPPEFIQRNAIVAIGTRPGSYLLYVHTISGKSFELATDKTNRDHVLACIEQQLMGDPKPVKP